MAGGVVWHDDRRRDALQLAGIGKGLRMIARGVGHDAPPALLVGERRDGVVGAPELEGATPLQVFALEEEFGFGTRICRARGLDGRLVGRPGDAFGSARHVVVGGPRKRDRTLNR
jgi:hypothetical protein